MIAVNHLILCLFTLSMAMSDNQKRLVLHSDQDISEVIHELRQEINTNKQEDQALKTQMAQENQALIAQVKALEMNMTQQKQTLTAQMDQEIQDLRNNLTKERQAEKAQMANENQVLRDQMTQENLALKAEIAKLSTGLGSTYVRWGRTDCEGNGTQKVYSGYAGGTGYNDAGGSSTTLCLPDSPSWAAYKDGIQNIGGHIFGTEYQISEGIFNPFGKHMLDEDVPCVLCHTTRAVTVMIPGSTKCYSGWTKEYTGYIMTNLYSLEAQTDFVCVDASPEAVLHGEDDKGGHSFYLTEVICGTLPCQVYPQGRELACTVCSK